MRWRQATTWQWLCVGVLLFCIGKHAAEAQVGLSPEERKKIQAHATMIAAEELYDHGERDKAIEQWREAITLDPGLARAHYDLGMALRGKGQIKEAMVSLREAVRLDPKNGAAHADLGDTLQEADDLDGAQAAYQTALAIVPTSAPLRNNLGYVLVRKGDLPGAIAEWRAATLADPKYPPAYFNLAEGLENLGKIEEAITAYERFLELVPSSTAGVAEVRERVAALKSGAKPPAVQE